MKKVLSIIMALVIAIGTFSVMASAYTFGSYITDGKYLLEPGYDIGSAPTFALGERVYGIVEENEVACYRFTPTTDEIITFNVKTSDEIEFTISKNGSNDTHTFSVTDTENKLYRLDKGAIYLVSVSLSEAVIDRDYGTMSADAAPASAEYCFYTTYSGMPASVAANINFKESTLKVGESLLLKLSDVTVPDLNVFWRVYDDPATLMRETDVATVSEDGMVTVKMNNGSFITDTKIKVQAVWYYGTSDAEVTKTCTINAVAANINLDPYFDTNTRQIYTGVGGFIDITAKSNLNNGIIWSSEDESIATVTPSGRITAVAVGKTTVKVTIAGTTISRRITVNVVEGHNSVIGVTLSEDNASVRVNEDIKLTHTLTTVNPDAPATNPKINFISSDPSIATVDKSGTVKGIATGKVTITIQTEDGGFKDTCEVTVKSAIPNWLMVVVAPLRIVINFFIMIFEKLSGK